MLRDPGQRVAGLDLVGLHQAAAVGDLVSTATGLSSVPSLRNGPSTVDGLASTTSAASARASASSNSMHRVGARAFRRRRTVRACRPGERRPVVGVQRLDIADAAGVEASADPGVRRTAPRRRRAGVAAGTAGARLSVDAASTMPATARATAGRGPAPERAGQAGHRTTRAAHGDGVRAGRVATRGSPRAAMRDHERAGRRWADAESPGRVALVGAARQLDDVRR